MNKKFKLIIKGIALLGIVGLLSSCGGSDPAPEGGGGSGSGAVTTGTLTGTWKSECVLEVDDSIPPVTNYEIVAITIDTTSITGIANIYAAADTTCVGAFTAEMFNLTYTLGSDVTVDGSVAGITTATKFDITELGPPPEIEYELAAIKDNKLYLGNTDGVNDGTSDALRPTQLDGTFFLTRQMLISKVLADDFDSGALATGVWQQSLDGVTRSIQGGRLVTTVTSSGTRESVNTRFTGDHTYMEITVHISSTSTISVGARGRARLAGYFYNDRRGLGSGLPYNGFEGDVWGQVTVDLLDDGTLVARAFIGPDDAAGINSIATFLAQPFSTSVQLDTDYVMSIEQTADGRLILTFNGESFTYLETGPMYPISELSYKGLTTRIYAGGTGGNLLVEWDDFYIEAP